MLNLQNCLAIYISSRKWTQELLRFVFLRTGTLGGCIERCVYVWQATPPLLEAAANSVGRGSSQDLKAKLAFKLRRVSGQEAHIQMNLLYRSLLSSQSSADLQAVNPFLSMELSELLSNMSVACILRASRLGHTNRCIVATATLLEKIDHGLKLGCQQANAAAASLRPNLQQSCAALAALLLTERHYVYDLKQEEGASDANDANKLGYDPRYLIFEFVWNILLRKKQVVIVDEFMTTLVRVHRCCCERHPEIFNFGCVLVAGGRPIKSETDDNGAGQNHCCGSTSSFDACRR